MMRTHKGQITAILMAPVFGGMSLITILVLMGAVGILGWWVTHTIIPALITLAPIAFAIYLVYIKLTGSYEFPKQYAPYLDLIVFFLVPVALIFSSLWVFKPFGMFVFSVVPYSTVPVAGVSLPATVPTSGLFDWSSLTSITGNVQAPPSAYMSGVLFVGLITSMFFIVEKELR